MKTLILFGTKTGSTEKCAMKIKESLAAKDAEILDIRRLRAIDLALYEVIIIGTPLYMGNIHGRIKVFLKKHRNALMGKKLHFFICGMARGEEGVAIFKKQIPEELFKHAAQVRQLGFEVNYKRMNPLFRMIMKKIIENEKPEIGLDYAGIDAFAGIAGR